jgi:myo-inositol-1(or 4)-monophosphatase
MLNTAVRAARAAGDIIVRHIDRLPELHVGTKSRNDYVSEVDRQAEQTIIYHLKKAYPDHAILAEETGGPQRGEFLWIVDPLDGTTNYLHGLPHYAVSIALQHHGRIEQAVIYDPIRQELFTATRGSGAFLNNRRIRVSKRAHLDGALLGTGFPFRAHRHFPAYQKMFAAFFERASDIRRAGSAALDLAYVAAGRLDGFWEIGLSPWDIAAGALLIREAGGLISDFTGGDGYLENGNVATANPKLLHEMLREIEPLLSSALRAGNTPSSP